MAVRDLLIGEDPEAVEGVKDSSLPTQPEIGVFDQLGSAIDKPSITGGALARWAMDTVEGSKDYSPQELSAMFPNAPQGTFQTRNTKRMGEWLYKRAINDDIYSNMNKLRSMGHGKIYNAITDVGYGIVQETSPTDILLGAVSGGLLSAATATANVAIKAGAMNLGLRGLSYMGQSTAKAIIASELAEGLITLPMDYAIRKGLETSVQEEASLGESIMGAFGGAVVSSGIRLAGRSLFKRISKVHERMDPVTKREFGNALEEELNAMNTPGTNWEMNGKHSELHPVQSLPIDQRLRYKVYSAAEGIPSAPAEEGKQPLYALFNKESSMAHNGAASPFGQTTFVASDIGELKAFSSSVKQKGSVVKLDPEEFKIFNVASPEEKTSKGVLKILEEGGVTSDTLEGAIKTLREMGDKGDILEFEIQEFLKSEGYDGIVINESEKILDKTFEKTNTFIFDGIADKKHITLEHLDGSLGGLPESTVFFQNTKANALKTGQGILTNGKEIKLDPHGYFNTDPFYGNPTKGIGYTEFYSADHIAEINRRVETGYPKSLKKKFQGLTDDLIEHVRQLNIMKKFEDASAIEEVIQKLPEEWDPIMKDILDTEHEIQLVEKMMIERGNYEVNKNLIKKTVEQQAKEGKVMRLLEKIDFDNITKKFIKRVEDRIGTPRESQTESIIRHYNDIIENLKKNNPDVVEEIVKATDFCLRKYTR